MLAVTEGMRQLTGGLVALGPPTRSPVLTAHPACRSLRVCVVAAPCVPIVLRLCPWGSLWSFCAVRSAEGASVWHFPGTRWSLVFAHCGRPPALAQKLLAVTRSHSVKHSRVGGGLRVSHPAPGPGSASPALVDAVMLSMGPRARTDKRRVRLCVCTAWA